MEFFVKKRGWTNPKYILSKTEILTYNKFREALIKKDKMTQEFWKDPKLKFQNITILISGKIK